MGEFVPVVGLVALPEAFVDPEPEVGEEDGVSGAPVVSGEDGEEPCLEAASRSESSCRAEVMKSCQMSAGKVPPRTGPPS